MSADHTPSTGWYLLDLVVIFAVGALVGMLVVSVSRTKPVIPDGIVIEPKE